MDHATLVSETHEFVDLHMTIGWTLAVCLVVLSGWRWLIWHRGQMTINTSYLIAAVAVLGLVFFQGGKGGKLFSSCGGGGARAGQGTKTVRAPPHPRHRSKPFRPRTN